MTAIIKECLAPGLRLGANSRASAFSRITADWSGTEHLIPQVLRGFPQVFAVAPAVGFGLGSLPPDRRGENDCGCRAALRRDPGQPGRRSTRRCENAPALAYREASTLDYADAFRAIMVAFVIAHAAGAAAP